MLRGRIEPLRRRMRVFRPIILRLKTFLFFRIFILNIFREYHIVDITTHPVTR